MGDHRQLNESVSVVQPGGATKRYLCPGCEGFIEPGVFHLVVVPDHEPDLRRHWHRGCWNKELRRRGDRRGSAAHDNSSGHDTA